MFYDFVLGKSLADDYMSNLYTNRFEEAQEITSYPQLVQVLLRELTAASNEIQIVPDVIDTIISGLTSMNTKYQKGVEVELVDTNLREMFSCAAYNGYEIFLIKRPDLKVAELAPQTRAYMIDKNDMFFPTLARVATGTSLSFDVPQDASIADVVMTFSKKVNFGNTTKNYVQLDKLQAEYDKLAMTHSSWTMDVRKIERFFNNYGYQFFVVL